MNQLKKTTLSTQVGEKVSEGKRILTARIRNTGSSLAFFTQVRLSNHVGKPINPAYYSDNFFNLLPGEEKVVKIELPNSYANRNKAVQLQIDAFNAAERQHSLN